MYPATLDINKITIYEMRKLLKIFVNLALYISVPPTNCKRLQVAKFLDLRKSNSPILSQIERKLNYMDHPLTSMAVRSATCIVNYGTTIAHHNEAKEVTEEEFFTPG
jgi:hypothetical protein